MLKKIIGIAILIITIILIVILVKSKKRPNFSQQPSSQELKVITETISPIKENILISANGNVIARWQTEIKSEVSGAITSISEKLLTGAAFKKGDELIKLETTNYESQLFRQKANLAMAQERLEEEKVRSQRAINDWTSLNTNKPASDYTIRKPQLHSAKMNLLAAQSDLKVAENNLNKTTIKAPYDGFVINKYVDIGETIQVGSSIADVFSSENIELILPLKNNQIVMLLANQDREIKVYDPISPEKYWIAQYSRVDQLIDQKSRWRNLFLIIDPKDNPNKELPIKGSFLQADISLNLESEFLMIDEKSLSMQGYIWVVTSENLLKKVKPSIAFRSNGSIYLNPLENQNAPIQLVSIPSTTLLEGVKVSQQTLNKELPNEK